MTMTRRRPLLLTAAVVLVALHVFAAVGHGDGGWLEQYGFPAALVDFFDVSFSDPLLFAGVTDFVVLIVAFGVWAISALPADRRREPRTLAWLAVYLVFPGLGAILYPLWLAS